MADPLDACYAPEGFRAGPGERAAAVRAEPGPRREIAAPSDNGGVDGAAHIVPILERAHRPGAQPSPGYASGQLISAYTDDPLPYR
jgi:hypothetical protein